MYDLGRSKYIIAALTCLTFLICATIVLALPFPEPLMTTEETRPASFDFENPAKRKTRCDWYRSRLGQYVSEINNAAAAARIPPELLTAVILNELADVGVEDVEQDQAIAWTQGDYNKFRLDADAGYIRVGRWWTQRPISSWSFGIAQIQPATALRYNAVHVPPRLLGDRERTEFYVAFSLLNRTVNIHAAARVIKGILQDIERYQTGPWARFFIRSGERFNAESPYAALKPPPSADSRAMHRERQRNLAQLVVAVYNSYGILTNTNPNAVPHPREVPSERKGDPEKYPNALLHSLNAQEIAEDLYASNACGMPLAYTREPDGGGHGHNRQFDILGRIWHVKEGQNVEYPCTFTRIGSTNVFKAVFDWHAEESNRVTIIITGVKVTMHRDQAPLPGGKIRRKCTYVGTLYKGAGSTDLNMAGGTMKCDFKTPEDLKWSATILGQRQQ